MAIATISNTGGLYSASSSWVGNFVPTSIDDVTSTTTSGPLTVDVQSAARSLNFGPYTSTLTMNRGLTVSGSVTLGLTMSIAGTYGLFINSSATMSSNGKTWSNSLTFGGTSTTFTLLDDWYVDSLIYSSTSGTITTTNGKTITASNGLTIATTAQIVGTTKIILTGGTWSHTIGGRISNSIDLNGNVNFGPNIYSGGGTISYISGSISSTGNTFNLQTGTLNLVNTNSINFNNFLNTGNSFLNGTNLNLLGNLTNNTSMSGNSTIVMKGAGTWSGGSYLGNSVTFDSGSNLIKVSGTVYFTSGTISYVSGSVSTTGSTLYIQTSGSLVSIGMNTDGVVWNDIYLHVASRDSTINLNLASNLNISGTVYIPVSGPNTLTIPAASFYYTFSGPGIFNPTGSLSIGNLFGVGGAGAYQYVTLPNDITLSSFQWNSGGLAADPAGKLAIFNGNKKIRVLGNFTNIGTVQVSITGNCTVELLGSGNFTLNGASSGLNLDISSTGTYSFLSTPIFSGSSIRYFSGVVSQPTSIYFIGCTLSTSGMTWTSPILRGNTGLLQDLNVNNLQTEITPVSLIGTYSVGVLGNLTTNVSTTGSNTIYINGTSSQTWSGSSNLSNNLVINKPSGTFSLSGAVSYSTGTFSYISGAVSTSNSTFGMSGSCNLLTSGITFSNISNTSTGNINLLNNLAWTGTWSATLGTITFTGSGILSPTPTTRINFSGSSAVTTPDSVIGYTFSSINITTSGITTLRGNLSTSGLLTLGGSGNINSASGLTGSITTTGGLSMTGNCSGTSFILLKSGTWSASGANYLNNNLRLEGDSTISGNVYYQSGTLSYISGVISTTNSTFNIGTTCNIDTNGIYWYNITNTSTATVNLITDLYWINNWSVTGGILTFTGSGSLTASSTGNVIFSGSSTVNLKNPIQVVNATLGITTINSSTMSVIGNLTVNNTTSGTTVIILNGTSSQTWSSSAYLSNNLTINKPSNSLLSLSSATYYQSGTFSYVSGSVSTTGNTLYLGSSCALQTNGITWNNVRLDTGTILLNLINNFNCIGDLKLLGNNGLSISFTGSGTFNPIGTLTLGDSATPPNGTNPITLNLPNDITLNSINYTDQGDPSPVRVRNVVLNGNKIINVNSSVSIGLMNGASISGNCTVVFSGNGDFFIKSGILYGPVYSLNTTINTSGTCSFTTFYQTNLGSSFPVFSSCTFSYVSGGVRVVTTNSPTNGSSGTLNQIYFSACRLNLNGGKWPINSIISGSTNLLDNATFSGNLTTQDTAVVINGSSYSISSEANLFINTTTSGNVPIFINGTAGQTWSHSSAVYLSNNLTINKSSGSLTLGPNVYYQSGTFSYVTGSVVTTGNTFSIGNSCNLNTNGISWYNIANTLTSTVNLISDLTWTNNWSVTGGTLTFTGSGSLSASSTSNAIFNGSSTVNLKNSVQLANVTSGPTTVNSATMSVSGNLTIGGDSGGTTNIIINGLGGQTWSHTSGYLSNNLTINKPSGLLTLGSNVFYQAGTLSHVIGQVDTSGGVLNLYSNAKLDTSNIIWNSVSTTAGPNSFLSNFYCNNFSSSGSAISINNSGGDLYLYKSLTQGVAQLLGTATIYFVGGVTWNQTNPADNYHVRNNIIIDTSETVTFGSLVVYAQGALTYRRGKVNAKGSTFRVDSSANLINCNKINFDTVTIKAGQIVTMNEFFSGSPILKTKIQSSSSTNYSIVFTNNFEKIAKFVNVTNCTLTNPKQLLIVTDSKKSSTNSSGIRYTNPVPNGISKNDSKTALSKTAFPESALVGDPTTQKTI